MEDILTIIEQMKRLEEKEGRRNNEVKEALH